MNKEIRSKIAYHINKNKSVKKTEIVNIIVPD